MEGVEGIEEEVQEITQRLKVDGEWNEEWERKSVTLSPFKFLQKLRQRMQGGSSGFAGNAINRARLQQVRLEIAESEANCILEMLRKKLRALVGTPADSRPEWAPDFLNCMEYLLREKASFPPEVFVELIKAMENRLEKLDA